ncbi:glycerophosphoryl diester phosphodiesterase [Hyphomicrobium nitrativorans NL23]|uniref:Glycerophosphoryl diester phosphodiesterase n=1 Tax=Hyphomicrobium nitrativorans NL23 TaxID=1029756 RepID=V5SCP6_9HYPH|nr:glycerophosphodiester phosphodiesterase family protein [Hyphomicrobium nitrativorans]AHB48671.1 glycerophosphoryl diester phosphodiesterase [Hyphomicrobium nitrativorans NL23]
MLDPVFLRPIAHRGLHDAAKGMIENTPAAFEAAIAKGYAIECDLVEAAGGLPIVFHDDTLDRLTESTGAVAGLGSADLPRIRFKESNTTGIPTFAEFLALCGPRVPLVVEIKSDWRPPHPAFLHEIARRALDHEGPIALMSFDPALMAALAHLAPAVPRGIVSGSYRNADGTPWWPRLSGWRTFCLRNLLEDRGAPPDFYAYEIDALPTWATRFARWRNRPVFAWTVRTDTDRARAAHHADAPIFEGFEP